MPIIKSNTKGKTRTKKDSFLEAFRDLGSDFSESLSPFPRPKSFGGGESGNNSEALFQRESDLEKKYQEQLQRVEQVRREEQILFTQKERQTQQMVKSLQEEIKGLAKATGDLAKEAQVAAMQEAPLAGKYHVVFFERLLKLVNRLRSQVQESASWLASFNAKSKKKNAYWGQFKKSGSKFMLSADRYSSTQAG